MSNEKSKNYPSQNLQWLDEIMRNVSEFLVTWLQSEKATNFEFAVRAKPELPASTKYTVKLPPWHYLQPHRITDKQTS